MSDSELQFSPKIAGPQGLFSASPPESSLMFCHCRSFLFLECANASNVPEWWAEFFFSFYLHLFKQNSDAAGLIHFENSPEYGCTKVIKERFSGLRVTTQENQPTMETNRAEIVCPIILPHEGGQFCVAFFRCITGIMHPVWGWQGERVALGCYI